MKRDLGQSIILSGPIVLFGSKLSRLCDYTYNNFEYYPIKCSCKENSTLKIDDQSNFP